MFARLEQEIKIRRYSQKTAKAYLHHNRSFLRFCRKDPKDVSTNDVRNYLEHLADKRCSGATMRQAYSSLLFYYAQILDRNIMRGIKIPKNDHKIIVGLTEEEVTKIISVIKNPKHLLLIELIYGSGVRVGEAVKIKVKDILVKEKLAIIRSGKGKRDRKTILSEKFIKDFNDNLDHDNYLFPGRNGHLTVRSVQQIVKTAARKAKIRKKVYPHLLRHAFATHLHKNDTNTRYIQKLLGHKSQKTTHRYIAVDEKDVWNVKSPHDEL